MAKYDSSAAWLLVDGYNLLAAKLKGLRYKIESITEPSHGLGDTWEEHTPVGLSKAEVAQEGGFYDTGTTNMHALFSPDIALGTTSTTRVVCLGVEGNTTGSNFVGFEGVYSQSYEVIASRGELTKANAEHTVTGTAEPGVILHELSAETANVATSDASLDHSAETQRVITIASYTYSTGDKTITCDMPHELSSSDTVVIVNTSGNTLNINGEHIATVTGSTTFTISTTSAGTSDEAGGSFTVGRTVDGGVGYLQVSALTLDLAASCQITIRDSTDNATFADLCAFTASTGVGAERKEVTGEVQRYLAHSATFAAATSGSCSVTYFTGFHRI